MSPPQFSPPPPPPPNSFSHHNLNPLSNFSQNSLPSPPPTLISPNSAAQQHNSLLLTTSSYQQQASGLNLNSFGRSNTLDRKLKPLLTQSSQMPLLNTVKTSKLINEANNIHVYSNSLERNLSFNQQRQFMAKNGPNSLNRNNLMFNMTNSTFMPQTNGQSVCTSPQRNSLNIPLKTGPFQTNKRPLSQDPMIESNSSFLISSSASSNDIISFNTNNISTPNQFSLSTIQQLKSELENARARILTLTNQLNNNVNYIRLKFIS